MLLPGENSSKSWLIVTILVSTIIAYGESSGGKTHSHEYHPRAMDGESSEEDSNSEKKKPSSEELTHAKKEESSKEHVKPDKSDDDDDGGNDDKNSDSGDDNTVRVTRGPKGDYEPEEENPKIHEKFEKNSESDNTSEDGRRYKRHIHRFGNVAKRR